ncbi:hypothetical protein ITI46_15920 [Streptomyces oryzae]|uniref:Secreted protein n=1 Tax=Streptomyces oryzae TaxID=1434886 RepID=A0ABS3XCM4_9ACTN|nr:DUF6479 family protein [Streptomyces oryzae]MBO8193143.1 hypothetical protein [Streptomyces oryzae]
MNADVLHAATDLANRDQLVGLVPGIIGLLIVAALIGAVWLGIRIKNREPELPEPDQQPHLPDTGPTEEVTENREPDEMPRDGIRRLPHSGVHDYGDREDHPGEPPRRRKWEPGKSGSFGSGGPG